MHLFGASEQVGAAALQVEAASMAKKASSMQVGPDRVQEKAASLQIQAAMKHVTTSSMQVRAASMQQKGASVKVCATSSPFPREWRQQKFVKPFQQRGDISRCASALLPSSPHAIRGRRRSKSGRHRDAPCIHEPVFDDGSSIRSCARNDCCPC
jgi:hypothetical protein